MNKFNVIFLDPAKVFLDKMDEKARKKVLYNIWKSKLTNDPEIFSKLIAEIWEFRIKFMNKEIRLLAFWDKTRKNKTLVIATHGFHKKSRKTPKKEIDRAISLMNEYFETNKL